MTLTDAPNQGAHLLVVDLELPSHPLYGKERGRLANSKGSDSKKTFLNLKDALVMVSETLVT